MKIQDIKDYPWPDEVHAAGLVGPGVPYLALRDETGKWFHSADFDDPDLAEDFDERELTEPDFIIWVRRRD